MSQIWTDNPFSSNAVGQTDLQSIENNFAAIKSAWSGPSAPASPIAGMWWHDTTTNILKHYYGGGWESVYDLANSRVLASLNSVNCSRNVIAGTGLDGGGVLSADRTITHAAHTGDVTGSGALTIGSAKVTTAKLKTSTSTVSTPTMTAANLYPSGGSYCFYPQVYRSSGSYTFTARICSQIGPASATTVIHISNSATPNVASARFRYVTSSGEVYWVFFCVDKKTGNILANSAAPDHVCFGNGGKPKSMQ